MAANLIADFRDGEYFTITATSNITSGNVWHIATLAGVALESGVTGDVVPIAMSGVYEVTKPTGFARSQGQHVYMDATTRVLTGTASGNVLLGTAWESATSGAGQNKIKVALKGASAVRPG